MNRFPALIFDAVTVPENPAFTKLFDDPVNTLFKFVIAAAGFPPPPPDGAAAQNPALLVTAAGGILVNPPPLPVKLPVT